MFIKMFPMCSHYLSNIIFFNIVYDVPISLLIAPLSILYLFLKSFLLCYMGRLNGKASRHLFSMVKSYYQYNHNGLFKIFCENSKDFKNLIEFTLSSMHEQLCRDIWLCFETQIESNHVHATYCNNHMWSWCVTLITFVESLIK